MSRRTEQTTTERWSSRSPTCPTVAGRVWKTRCGRHAVEDTLWKTRCGRRAVEDALWKTRRPRVPPRCQPASTKPATVSADVDELSA